LDGKSRRKERSSIVSPLGSFVRWAAGETVSNDFKHDFKPRTTVKEGVTDDAKLSKILHGSLRRDLHARPGGDRPKPGGV